MSITHDINKEPPDDLNQVLNIYNLGCKHAVVRERKKKSLQINYS